MQRHRHTLDIQYRGVLEDVEFKLYRGVGHMDSQYPFMARPCSFKLYRGVVHIPSVKAFKDQVAFLKGFWSSKVSKWLLGGELHGRRTMD